MSATLAAPPHVDLLLVPMTDALPRLRERTVRVRVLTPPYASAGAGALRVVRVAEQADAIALEVTYERFQLRRTGSKGR
ncbi:MAG TPA: hypothetical protein VN934_11685 [Candidatus Tumulicola sp.]|nr:hypothetical protein [Candidatus Tumulicola sp.]